MMVNLRKYSGGLHAIDTVDTILDMQQYFDKAEIIPVYINMMETAQKKAASAKLPI